MAIGPWYTALVSYPSRRLALCLLALPLFFGCSGSSDQGSPGAAGSAAQATRYQTREGFCAGPVTLSGGDLVGQWTVFEVCAISASIPGNCADAPMSLSLSAAGTVTFNADQSANIDVTLNMKKQFMPLLSCVAASDCGSFASKLTSELTIYPGASATCVPASGDASRCACEEQLPAHAFRASGNETESGQFLSTLR